MFYDMAVLSQVSELTLEMIKPVLTTPVRFIQIIISEAEESFKPDRYNRRLAQLNFLVLQD